MEPQLLTSNFLIKEPLLSKVISFLEAKRVTDKNTVMFIMTGKEGHYQSMPQTAAANVSGPTEAPRVLDLSLNTLALMWLRLIPGSLGRTVQEAESPACCDPTTCSHTVIEKRHQPPFAGETWHQMSTLSNLRTLTIKTYSKDLNGHSHFKVQS